MNEFIRNQEERWQERFSSFAEKQASAFEAEIKRALLQEREKLDAINSCVPLESCPCQGPSHCFDLFDNCLFTTYWPRDCRQWREYELQRISSEVNMAARAELQKVLKQIKEEDSQRTTERVRQLESLTGRVQGLKRAMHTMDEYTFESQRTHKLATAALALVNAFEYGARRPLTEEVEALRVAANDDPVIVAALEQLPPSAHSTRGVTTRQELIARFYRVAKAARAAALTPPDSGVAGHALGAVTSGLLLRTSSSNGSELDEAMAQTPRVPGGVPPSSSARPLAADESTVPPTYLGRMLSKVWETEPVRRVRAWGADSVAQVRSSALSALPPAVASRLQAGRDDASLSSERTAASKAAISVGATNGTTAALDEAEGAVLRGDLTAALKVLDKLEGYPAAAVDDWLVEAKHRVRLEQSMRLVRAHTACLVARLY